MKWQLKNIETIKDQFVFMPNFGVIKVNRIDIIFIEENGHEINYLDLFYKKQNQMLRNEELSELSTKLKSLYKRKYYKSKYVARWGSKEEYIPINIKGIYLRFNCDQFNYSQRYFSINLDEHNDTKIWASKNYDSSQLRSPIISEINENNNYYYLGIGVVKVIEVYNYPNIENKICKVQKSDGKTFDIYLNNDYKKNFYYLPYETVNIYSNLDYNINEIQLLPYACRENNTWNIYWKYINEAANYIVSLYKIIECYGEKEFYHLKDYIVDRNEKFLTVSGLAGSNFVFKVYAEDRNGKKIAVSRCIVNGTPTYMGIESK